MSKISRNAKIGKNVRIGDFAIIHDHVEIGEGSVIESHCVIGKPSNSARGKMLKIGRHATIRSHSVLYEGSTFGDGFQTGHSVLLREDVRAGKALSVGSFSEST